MDVELIALGLLVGVMMISLGGGGGALYIGILTSIAHLSAASAVSTSLYVSLPALVLGTYLYYRSGNIQFGMGNRMLLATVPSVIIGSVVARFIPKALYTWGIAITLMVLGIQILLMKKGERKNARTKWIQPIFYGCSSGLMVGIGGMSGGGPIMAGLLIMGMEIATAVATSAYVLVCSSIIGLIFHIDSANINWATGNNLMIGSLVGAIIAPLVINRLNIQKTTTLLKPIVGGLMIIMGLNMLI